MDSNIYQQHALRTANLKENGIEETIVNVSLGLSGESGEFADHIKKWKFQGHEFDNKHLAKELGDILWYCAVGAASLGYTLDEIMIQNVEKLKKRYPNGFDAEKSINRQE